MDRKIEYHEPEFNVVVTSEEDIFCFSFEIPEEDIEF